MGNYLDTLSRAAQDIQQKIIQTHLRQGCTFLSVCLAEKQSGVNICPKKSEPVYPGNLGILELSVLVNQKIFKTVY